MSATPPNDDNAAPTRPEPAHASDPAPKPAPELTPAQRRELKAKAHHLHPVVTIGQHGLSDAVVNETDRALAAHQLIKVRVLGDHRQERSSLLDALSQAVGAAAVQHIGKTLVLWRPAPPASDTPKVKPAARRRELASRPVMPRGSAAATPKRRGGSLDTRPASRQNTRRKTPRGGSSQGR